MLLLLLALLACARPLHQAAVYQAAVYQAGVASWYGPGFAGKPTASGEAFRPGRRTAAHPSLPFGTVVKVTRVDTGKSVRVVINDRGPFTSGRIIDLSQRAARRLEMIELGLSRVELRRVGCRDRFGKCG